jgi:PHP family Zn ribbon phosphoesterase
VKLTEDSCHACGANLRGEPIPETHREHYGNATHFSRLIALYDQGRDRTVAYQCPDCGNTVGCTFNARMTKLNGAHIEHPPEPAT